MILDLDAFIAGIGIGIMIGMWIGARTVRRAVVEHRTIDGGRLCPYPNMTDDDLAHFEEFERSLSK